MPLNVSFAENAPIVSVIMPVYNAAEYLEETLGYITHQSLVDIEIICVDDGSTDQSRNILENCALRDSRFVILSQPKSNAGAARNLGLSVARGKYLSFLDADDIFDVNMLETAYHFAEEREADVVVFGSSRYWEESGRITDNCFAVKPNLLPRASVFCAQDVRSDFFQCILGYTWDKLFRREFVIKEGLKFQEQPVYNDALFVYSALLTASKITVLNQSLIKQRKRKAKDSISDRRYQYFDCSVSFLLELRLFLEGRGLSDRFGLDWERYALHMLDVDYFSRKDNDSRVKILDYLVEEGMGRLGLCLDDASKYEGMSAYDRLVRELERYKKRYIDRIPVVYAADREYLKYVAASIESAMRSKAPATHYRFIVLLSEKRDSEEETVLSQIVSKDGGSSVEFIEVHDAFAGVEMKIPHITTATYYRLLLPDLLKECSRCLYLDGDTIICDDLTDLFLTDLGDNWIAGVRAFVYYKSKKNHSERLGLNPGTFEYVNAGVLLLDLDRLRENRCSEAFLDLTDKAFDSQDQDIINVVCEGRIKILPYRYNLMTKYHSWSTEDYGGLANKEEVEEAKRNPVVIHYADRTKPWNNPSSYKAEQWWATVLRGDSWCCFRSDAPTVLLGKLQHERRAKDKAIRERNNARNEAERLKQSRSFQFGYSVLKGPRKIKTAVMRCLKKIEQSDIAHRGEGRSL